MIVVYGLPVPPTMLGAATDQVPDSSRVAVEVAELSGHDVDATTKVL
jgi:hypothetical protein